MRHLFRHGSAVLVALLLGIGSAWWAISNHLPPIQNGAWRYDPLVGSGAADPYLRARVAKVALLALNNSEALYFFAGTDDEGDPLRSDQSYRLEGRDFDCRWWSITAYDADGFLMPNQQERYSYNMTNLERNAEGGYTLFVSRSPRPGNWIPIGEGETFALALRIYNAAPAVHDQLGTIALPRIIREGRRHD
jgi:hypothetical protein